MIVCVSITAAAARAGPCSALSVAIVVTSPTDTPVISLIALMPAPWSVGFALRVASVVRVDLADCCQRGDLGGRHAGGSVSAVDEASCRWGSR